MPFVSWFPAVFSVFGAAVLLFVYFAARKKGLTKRLRIVLIAGLSVFLLCLVVWGVCRNFVVEF